MLVVITIKMTSSSWQQRQPTTLGNSPSSQPYVPVSNRSFVLLDATASMHFHWCSSPVDRRPHNVPSPTRASIPDRIRAIACDWPVMANRWWSEHWGFCWVSHRGCVGRRDGREAGACAWWGWRSCPARTIACGRLIIIRMVKMTLILWLTKWMKTQHP